MIGNFTTTAIESLVFTRTVTRLITSLWRLKFGKFFNLEEAVQYKPLTGRTLSSLTNSTFFVFFYSLLVIFSIFYDNFLYYLYCVLMRISVLKFK